jgi:hypothetical protein
MQKRSGSGCERGAAADAKEEEQRRPNLSQASVRELTNGVCARMGM